LDGRRLVFLHPRVVMIPVADCTDMVAGDHAGNKRFDGGSGGHDRYSSRDIDFLRY
jgi:hypothetical protein